ncbi:hypothetical protein LOY67_06795 [Pseudomonas sp. B21-056]|jgi:hypothetical protein|uniref:hypothetical protein n=1 Tax=Pseudomonas sp. B21-056 TaxID=2895495 RepID=UPI002232C063|nr:hypothetical protein [Pseudomonas sp. B21-056]UZE25116.1 hypothetical protein LOY67_06795 [Pseudomonas sp. B21-056]
MFSLNASGYTKSTTIPAFATEPPVSGSIESTAVAVVWQNILQSDVLQMLSEINPPPSGSFIDYRYWANGILRWALSQQDDDGNPLYAFAIPSWETGFDDDGNPVVGAFLFPVGTQVTVLQPSDNELNAALASAYGNQPPLTLTSNQTGDPDERRWAAAAHAYALTQNDANGNAYVAGIPSWEMAVEGDQTIRGVFAFSNTPGIQVLEAGRAALMDQILAGILDPLNSPNLMDTNMSVLAVAANRWAMRYSGVCGAGTFGYCSAKYPEGDEWYSIFTHDIVICFAPQQPTMDLLQSIVDQPAVAWPDFNGAYSALCIALGNIINGPNSNDPLDPRELAASSDWSPNTVATQLDNWLQFDTNGNYSLSPTAPVAPTGVAADDWLQIIYTVWQEMSAVGQLQSLYTYTQGTLNTAQGTANTLINGAIANMQAKTDDSTLLDFGQLLKDLGYSLVWFFSGTTAAWANLAAVAVTDVIRVITNALGGTSSSITIGQYWDQVADSFEASNTSLSNFYTTIASDHGRLMNFYRYADNGNLPIPTGNNGGSSTTDHDSSTATAMANGLMLQAYQNLMPLYWAIAWAAPDPYVGPGYSAYTTLTIPEAPEGTYVEGPYYEFAIVWSNSGVIKSYPTSAMMTDLTDTLNVNLMDVLARTEPWLGITAWFGWFAGTQVNVQGPYSR